MHPLSIDPGQLSCAPMACRIDDRLCAVRVPRRAHGSALPCPGRDPSRCHRYAHRSGGVADMADAAPLVTQPCLWCSPYDGCPAGYAAGSTSETVDACGGWRLDASCARRYVVVSRNAVVAIPRLDIFQHRICHVQFVRVLRAAGSAGVGGRSCRPRLPRRPMETIRFVRCHGARGSADDGSGVSSHREALRRFVAQLPCVPYELREEQEQSQTLSAGSLHPS